MATPIKMFKVTEEEANSIDVVDGQIIFATDSNKIYLDTNGKRVCCSHNNITTFVQQEQPVNASNGDIWLVAEDGGGSSGGNLNEYVYNILIGGIQPAFEGICKYIVSTDLLEVTPETVGSDIPAYAQLDPDEQSSVDSLLEQIKESLGQLSLQLNELTTTWIKNSLIENFYENGFNDGFVDVEVSNSYNNDCSGDSQYWITTFGTLRIDYGTDFETNEKYIYSYNYYTNDSIIMDVSLVLDKDTKTWTSFSISTYHSLKDAPAIEATNFRCYYEEGYITDKNKVGNGYSPIIITDKTGFNHFFGIVYKYDDEGDQSLPFQAGETILTVPKWYSFGSIPHYYDCPSNEGTTQRIECVNNTIKIGPEVTGKDFIDLNIITIPGGMD